MKAIERHRQTWQGKSDEWLFERLDNELKQKVEEIHRLLAENETLRQSFTVGRSQFIELVEELNTELYERFGEVEVGFEYSTTGFVDAICFNGVLLWNSEMETREWIEEKNDYEPFEPFISRVFNEYLDKMYTLKL